MLVRLAAEQETLPPTLLSLDTEHDRKATINQSKCDDPE
jgi:hypothetical protein